MTTTRQEVSSADGTRIALDVSGTGPPLLIIPGTSTDPRSWDAVRAVIDPRRTVAVMTRRAVLGDPLGTLDIHREFEDVVAAAQSLGVAVDVLGHDDLDTHAAG